MPDTHESLMTERGITLRLSIDGTPMIYLAAETLQCLRLSRGANQNDGSPQFADGAAFSNPFAASSNNDVAME